jgi:hypothetical protein
MRSGSSFSSTSVESSALTMRVVASLRLVLPVVTARLVRRRISAAA